MSLPANPNSNQPNQSVKAKAKANLARARRKKKGYRSNRHIVFKCYYHVTF